VRLSETVRKTVQDSLGQSRTVLHDRDSDKDKKKQQDSIATKKGSDLWTSLNLLRKEWGMGDVKAETGRDRVRTILLEPLEPLGLARPKDLNAAAFKKMRQALVDHLAYMSAESLHLLHLTVCENLQGPNKDRWPAPAAIYGWARAIEPEPAGETELVISYLKSRAGARALQGGYLVELRTDLTKYRRPPSDAAMKMIQERAQANARRRTIISESAAVGRASAKDLAWVEAYWELHAVCADLVNAGVDARAAKEAGQAA
jgi:hypothetical protein